ncbi:MAG: O-antigen ligase family protein [Saprospiraceae bacterium]|nr:O-antigen ligase family protein [Saprospiraceae bacterium]
MYALPFFVYFISAFLNHIAGFGVDMIRIKLPYLFLPIAFAALPQLNIIQWKVILSALVICVIMSTFGVWYTYFFHQESILTLMKQGKPMPTPMSHIRYSLTVVISIIAALTLLMNSEGRKIKMLLVVAITYLIFFLHFLAVRSGLFSFYLLVILWFIFYSIKHKRYVLGSLALLIVGIALIFSIKYIPSLQEKLRYTKWEWEMTTGMITKDEGNYSDKNRLVSLKFGYELFKENPIFGVGISNIHQLMDEKYKQSQFANEQTLLPHSQWITVLAACGIVGFLFFFLGLFSPLLVAAFRQDFFILNCFALLVISFASENTIETAIGTALFTFYPLLGMKKYI